MRTPWSTRSRPPFSRPATRSRCCSGTARRSPPGPSLRRATLPARVLWSEQSRRTVGKALVDFAPDVVHLHNTFPLLTPSVLYACRDAGVPVVATIHNYKLGCANGSFFRDGRVCHDCLGGASLPALAHGCYRGSARGDPADRASARGCTPPPGGRWSAPTSSSRPRNATCWRRSACRRNAASSSTTSSRRPPRPMRRVEHQVAYVGRLDEAKGALVPDAGVGRLPGSPSPLAAAARGGRRRRDGPGGRRAGRPPTPVSGWRATCRDPRHPASSPARARWSSPRSGRRRSAWWPSRRWPRAPLRSRPPTGPFPS